MMSCGHTCPKPIPPPPVTVIAAPVACNLPALPMPLSEAIGFPAPDGHGIYVSLSDWARLGGYLTGVAAWIDAAGPCIVGRP